MILSTHLMEPQGLYSRSYTVKKTEHSHAQHQLFTGRKKKLKNQRKNSNTVFSYSRTYPTFVSPTYRHTHKHTHSVTRVYGIKVKTSQSVEFLLDRTVSLKLISMGYDVIVVSIELVVIVKPDLSSQNVFVGSLDIVGNYLKSSKIFILAVSKIVTSIES